MVVVVGAAVAVVLDGVAIVADIVVVVIVVVVIVVVIVVAVVVVVVAHSVAAGAIVTGQSPGLLARSQIVKKNIAPQNRNPILRIPQSRRSNIAGRPENGF